MSGTVKIDSGTAESAISGLTVAQDEIEQCEGDALRSDWTYR